MKVRSIIEALGRVRVLTLGLFTLEY